MNTFDDREHAFEAQYKHDEETRFRMRVRRTKLFGIWVAAELGFEEPEADAYARQLVSIDFEAPGDAPILERAHADLTDHGIQISEHRLAKELDGFARQAHDQIMTE
ncbi:MAG: DUF1476 domain-containing protein [Pseudomonadota bacterium]|nr:DUF1476 domain-containing protein [Pseudomonadota bacterium]